MKKVVLGKIGLGRVSFLVPSDGIIIRKIPFSMAVGTYLGPKRIVVAFAEGAQQAGQPDEGEIEPAEASAIGSMAELMLAN